MQTGYMHIQQKQVTTLFMWMLIFSSFSQFSSMKYILWHSGYTNELISSVIMRGFMADFILLLQSNKMY